MLELCSNLSIIFSTLDPLPEANMTIFLEDNFIVIYCFLLC
jgi:hypothetical protein